MGKKEKERKDKWKLKRQDINDEMKEHPQAGQPASQPHKETEDGESTWQDRQFMKYVGKGSRRRMHRPPTKLKGIV